MNDAPSHPLARTGRRLSRWATTLAAGLLLLSATACTTNPYTGRSQLKLFPEQQVLAMGVEAYGQVEKSEPVSRDPALNAPLMRVGRAISAVADQMRAEQGEGPFEWEFKVIDKPDMLNAWCLPGGKIAFYTGIYPVLEDEAGMAIVMGHEVAHALLDHSNERMSQQGLTQIGMVGAAIVAEGSEHRDLALAALGAGLTVGFVLPYSRSHESEADRVGLIMAARAGYDPEAAIRVWQNMAKLSEGRPPEFLSTHPDPLNRIEAMREWMPEAKALYERSRKQRNAPLPAIRSGQ